MVIKEVTPLRKQEFHNQLNKIIEALSELRRLGVANEDIIGFLYKWNKGKTIFKAKFYIDPVTNYFAYKTNFPDHFDYFKQYVKKEKPTEDQPTPENDSINSELDEASETVKKKGKVKMKKLKDKSKA